MPETPEPPDKSKAIASHVFSGSTTMIGVCITVIALFKVMKLSVASYADEILGIDNFIFIAAALLSYTTIRNNNKYNTEKWADILFFTGMSIMLIVGVIIVFTTY